MGRNVGVAQGGDGRERGKDEANERRRSRRKKEEEEEEEEEIEKEEKPKKEQKLIPANLGTESCHTKTK